MERLSPSVITQLQYTMNIFCTIPAVKNDCSLLCSILTPWLLRLKVKRQTPCANWVPCGHQLRLKSVVALATICAGEVWELPKLPLMGAKRQSTQRLSMASCSSQKLFTHKVAPLDHRMAEISQLAEDLEPCNNGNKLTLPCSVRHNSAAISHHLF